MFRTLLFKVFNRIPTWQRLEAGIGEVSWREYDYARYERVLTAAFTSGERLYSAAYVVPPPAFGEARKHANHLRLLELMMSTDVAGKVRSAGSLRGAFEVLRSYPAIGELPRLPVRDRPELLAGARRMTRWSSSCRALARGTASASASAGRRTGSRLTSSAIWPTTRRSTSPASACTSAACGAAGCS